MSASKQAPLVERTFTINFADITERLDPLYYFSVNNLLLVKNTKYEVKKLSEVIDMQRGRFGHRPRNDPQFYGGIYPFIQTGDIVRASYTGEKIGYSQTLNELGLKTSRLFSKPVVVLTIAANIGDTAILDFPACFPDSLIAMTPKNNLLELGYINIYFKLIKSYLEDLAPQSAQKNINYQQLAPVPIVVPPKKIQARIVEVYDSAFALKQQKEQQANTLLTSIDTYLLAQLGIVLLEQDNRLEKRIFTVPFNSIRGGRLDPIGFQAEVSPLFSSRFDYFALKEIASYFRSGFGIGKQDQADSETGIIQVRPTNIDSNGDLVLDRNVYVPNIVHDIDFLQVGDVLFNNTNSQELVGKTALLDDAYVKLTYSNHITVIRPDPSILNPIYLQSVLNLYQKNKYFYSVCTNWNNQSGVGIELLKNIKIPVPDIEQQNVIAANIKDIKAKYNSYRSEIEKILARAREEVECMILGN